MEKDHWEEPGVDRGRPTRFGCAGKLI